jgi:hypothetical protein
VTQALRILALLLLSAMPAAAERPAAAAPDAAALLDPARVPYLSEQGRADYARFLLQPTPRVFALSPNGAWGWAAAIEDDAEATEMRALENCRRWAGQECEVHVRDLTLVDGSYSPPPVPRAPLAGEGPWQLNADRRFIWHGPERARGVYVWAHGRSPGGADSRGSQPQPHARAFNNAGYDIIRLDRDPRLDETEAGAAWMRKALAELRARGYRRVVAAGQSRGAWNALQALDQPGLADAVIAIAPAAHGPTGSPAHAWALDDLRRIVARASAPGARVAIANFQGDPFDPDPTQRAAIFRSFTGRVGALMVLDRPAGIEGHGGGNDWRFTTRYAECLLDFAEGRTRSCDGTAR